MTDALWYTARGTGVVALILLTVVMVLGIAARSGQPAFGLPRFAVSLIHRNAALIATVLIAIHVTTLLFDPYAQLTFVNLVIPFTAGYRPLWVGLGTTTLDLVIALVATSLLRRRIGARTWRAVHLLAYACWPIAWLHGIGSGTDRGTGWYLAAAVICALAVGTAVIWRLLPARSAGAGPSRVRAPATMSGGSR
jgi:methionine sulfoxide reductase heme-binding subunit